MNSLYHPTEIKARVASQGTNWVDPHNGGHYTILSDSQNEIHLERKTGGAGKYVLFSFFASIFAIDGNNTLLRGRNYFLIFLLVVLSVVRFRLRSIHIIYRYTDKIHINLQSGNPGKCEIHSCSRSQVNSYLDFSTNYCNIIALYCGNLDGKNCAPVKHDFASTQTSARSHAGASSNVKDCKLGDPGQAGVVVVKGRNLRSRLFNA